MVADAGMVKLMPAQLLASTLPLCGANTLNAAPV